MASVVLITGASGFIGTYVTLFFESLGHRVVPVDIQPPTYDLSLLPIKVSSAKLDITDYRDLAKLCKKRKVTHVVHAAHPREEESPEVFTSCLQGMRNVLDVAKDLGVQRVVFASSGLIYGRNKKRERSLVKEDDPVGLYPSYLHRVSKVMGECLGNFYAQSYGVRFVALRFSSVYGPGQSGGLGEAIREGILGRECRPCLSRIPDDPIFVKDAVQAVQLACFSDKPLSPAYNIGCGKGYYETDLERVLKKHLPGVSFRIGKPPVSKTVDQLPHSHLLDISLARDELGFSPGFDLDTGVAAVAKWVRSEKRRMI